MHTRLRLETIRHLQLVAALGVVLGCGALAAWDALVSPRAPFLRADPRAAWIQEREPVSTGARHPREDPTRFERVFALEAPPAEAWLLLRTLGEAVVRVNGRVVSGDAPLAPSPKRVLRLPVAAALRAGENVLAVDLRRPLGLPVLWLTAEGLDAARLATAAADERDATAPGAGGPGWQTRRGNGPLRPAAEADDTRPLPDARSVPSAAAEIARRAPALLAGFAAASLLAALALRGPRAAALGARAPAIVLAAVLLLWAMVFVRKALAVPFLAGFDASGHWEYVSWLLTHHGVPLATDGWSLYHPPLFYLLPAAIVALAGQAEPGSLSSFAVKLFTFLGGVALVLASAAVARRLYADDPRSRAFAIAIAGFLPMSLYVSCYFSNESWSAGLLALALAQAVRTVHAPSPGARDAALLGLLLGAALLTKYTAVVMAPIVLLFFALRLALDPRIALARAASCVALAAAVALAVSGWFYARNLVLLGEVLPSNWGELEVASGRWWQLPSYHTARWYLGFGESLAHPWFAGFASFSDALYATLWGDGYIAGRRFLSDRLALWNHGLMAATYPMALPATLLLGLGIARGALDSLRERCPARRLTLALLGTVAFVLLAALVPVSLRYPYYAQVKAFYVLPIAVPIAVLGAAGFAALDRTLARAPSVAPRALFLGACATFAGAIALVYAG